MGWSFICGVCLVIGKFRFAFGPTNTNILIKVFKEICTKLFKIGLLPRAIISDQITDYMNPVMHACKKAFMYFIYVYTTNHVTFSNT